MNFICVLCMALLLSFFIKNFNFIYFANLIIYCIVRKMTKITSHWIEFIILIEKYIFEKHFEICIWHINEHVGKTCSISLDNRFSYHINRYIVHNVRTLHLIFEHL